MWRDVPLELFHSARIRWMLLSTTEPIWLSIGTFNPNRTVNQERRMLASVANNPTCNVVRVAFEKSISAKPIEAHRANIATNTPKSRSGVRTCIAASWRRIVANLPCLRLNQCSRWRSRCRCNPCARRTFCRECSFRSSGA